MEFQINGRILGLSESSDGTKLLGKILICPLDTANLNKKGIKESDLTETELKSLVGQPLVGKIVKTENNESDFSGHNLKKVYEYNPETNTLEVKYKFDTYPIGYFTTSEIEELEIDGVIKRCIVANVEIWTRYEQTCQIILKRFESGKQLSVSWEIDYADSYLSENTTWLKDLVFIGVAVLGESVKGAYPDAKFIEVSELEDEEELIVSLTEDAINEQNIKIETNPELIATSSIEDEGINDINKDNQGGKNMSENIKNTVASLTDTDLYTKVRQAINGVNPNDWYYISYLFPYEYRAIAHRWEDNDTDFTEFKYTVNSDDSVSITSQTAVKMQFVLAETIEAKDTQIAELTEKLTEKETELSTKLDEVIKLGEEIQAKDTVIAELTPYKEQVEVSEAEKKEAEIAQQKEELKAYATKTGFITEEEIEKSEELQTAISELNVTFIKGMIADRVVASLDKEPKNEVETSSVNTQNAQVDLNANNVETDPLMAFKDFLK